MVVLLPIFPEQMMLADGSLKVEVIIHTGLSLKLKCNQFAKIWWTITFHKLKLLEGKTLMIIQRRFKWETRRTNKDYKEETQEHNWDKKEMADRGNKDNQIKHANALSFE